MSETQAVSGKSSPTATELRLARQGKTPREHFARNSDAGPLAVSVLVPLSRIDSSPLNPRKRFDVDDLQALAASLADDGLLQPIIVKPAGDRYVIVAGERRWRAAQQLEWANIAAIVRPDVDDATHLRLALLENLARTDLDPLEEADGYRQLQDMGMTQQAIAAAVHRSQPAIANAIRLLSAPEEVRARVARGEITPSHVLALLRFSSEFPQVLVKIAEIAAQRHTPTKVLEGGLDVMGYEFTSALVADKLVVDVVRAEFDRDVCQQCPFGAYASTRYGGYCLKPDHFRQLQKEARATRKTEVDQALEAASTDGNKALKLNSLQYGQYERLDHSGTPKGCSPKCECRATALDHANHPVQICLKPQHFRQLRQEQQKREQEKREARAKGLSDKCGATLTAVADVASHELALVVAACCEDCNPQQFQQLLAKHAPGFEIDAKRELDDLATLQPLQLLKIAVEAVLGTDISRLNRGWGDNRAQYAGWYAGEFKSKRKSAAAAEEQAAVDELEEMLEDAEPELAGVAS